MNTTSERTKAPVWASRWLWAAGIYNLLWGAVTIAFPNFLFDLAGIERVNFAEIWQCVGMIVGVYGIGYIIAASDPRNHWPIVLVGLLGKIFGPIGFTAGVSTRDVSAALRFNDSYQRSGLVGSVCHDPVGCSEAPER